MRRILLLVLALAVVAGGAFAWLNRGEISVALMRRYVGEAMATSTVDDLPDGLSALFCGTGSPLPDRARAGPCLAVVAGTRVFLFDAGEGAAETLSLMGVGPERVEALFLTHLHSDHIDGLGAIALQHWAAGAARVPLPVYGGPGTERVVAGFNEAYAIDSTYRIAHHGASVVPPEGFGMTAQTVEIPENVEQVTVLEDGGVRIVAFRVDHGPVHPAYGYRVEYKGRSIVVSGDTATSLSLQRAATGADLLVHEGLSPRLVGVMEDSARASNRAGVAKIMHDIVDYHTSPEDAAGVAEGARVGALAFTHLLPPMPLPTLEGPFLGDARTRFSGPIWVMRDGDIISLPAAGGMERRHVLR